METLEAIERRKIGIRKSICGEIPRSIRNQ